MTRLVAALHDPRTWRLAAILFSLVLAACQNNPDGGGGGGGADGY